MGEKVTFILGLHNHQPVGNFDHILEEAYNKAYKPFIELVKDYPEIPFALHNSGILWDWFTDRHPDYIETVDAMVRSGQAEIMSGGYYEPILTVIPEHDRMGQLSMMAGFVAKRFGAAVRGCWLTERIWDPYLPSTLARAGLDYVIVDDSHFKSTGFTADQMRGFFLTEESDLYVRVFPIDKKLRYMIPFHDPGEIIEYFRSISAEPGDARKIAVLADDGEKFGLWPGTHSLCYGEKWLRRFFDALRDNSDWLEVSTFSRVIEEIPTEGIVYLPTASYSEMMEWALPIRAQERYQEAKQILLASGKFPEAAESVRGGFWRNFLVKYEESNWMHKRMLQVSALVEELGDKSGRSDAWKEARDHLYQAQCNCAYWHGLFGGLYLPHLRSAIFKHLVAAEKTIEREKHGSARFIDRYQRDIDGDGVIEAAVSNGVVKAIMKTKGAVLRELDVYEPPFNLTDTLTRREEIYHRDLARLESDEGKTPATPVSLHDSISVKEKGLEKRLIYDKRPRASLVDHFVSGKTGLDSFADSSFTELGDFVDGLYDLDIEEKGKGCLLRFSRTGTVLTGGDPVGVSMRKTIGIGAGSSSLDVSYTIAPSGGSLDCRFAVENVFSFLAGNAPDRFFRFPGRKIAESHLASRGEEKDVGRLSIVDEWLNLSVDIDLDPAALLWRFPLETVSNSDSGFERVYQGSALIPAWEIKVTDGEKAAFRILITVSTAGN